MPMSGLCLLAVLWSNPAPHSEVRTWTDATGDFSIEAKLIKVLDETAHLQTTTGRSIKVPVKRLSRADIRFVRTWERESGIPAPVVRFVARQKSKKQDAIDEERAHYLLETAKLTIIKRGRIASTLGFRGATYDKALNGTVSNYVFSDPRAKVEVINEQQEKIDTAKRYISECAARPLHDFSPTFEHDDMEAGDLGVIQPGHLSTNFFVHEGERLLPSDQSTWSISGDQVNGTERKFAFAEVPYLSHPLEKPYLRIRGVPAAEVLSGEHPSTIFHVVSRTEHKTKLGIAFSSRIVKREDAERFAKGLLGKYGKATATTINFSYLPNTLAMAMVGKLSAKRVKSVRSFDYYVDPRGIRTPCSNRVFLELETGQILLLDREQDKKTFNLNLLKEAFIIVGASIICPIENESTFEILTIEPYDITPFIDSKGGLIAPSK